jgi:hypothetical protein
MVVIVKSPCLLSFERFASGETFIIPGIVKLRESHSRAGGNPHTYQLKDMTRKELSTVKR